MIDLTPLLGIGLLLVRPTVLLLAAPVFGGGVPPQVRIGLALMIAWLSLPLVAVPAASSTMPLLAVVTRELAIGLALAFAVRVLVAAAEFGGQFAGYQIGLSYGTITNPQSGVRNTAISGLYSNLALVVFFGVNGHHALLRGLVSSYTALPIGVGGGVNASLVGDVSNMLGTVFVIGFRLAAPVVFVLLVVEAALGLVSRMVPSLNLMIVGMPIRLVAGLLVLATAIGPAPAVLGRAVSMVLDIGARAAGAFR